jgi:hypothetical protein
MKKGLAMLVLVLLMTRLAFITFAGEPDPSGAKTGGAADVVGASANAPTVDDLYGHHGDDPYRRHG